MDIKAKVHQNKKTGQLLVMLSKKKLQMIRANKIPKFIKIKKRDILYK